MNEWCGICTKYGDHDTAHHDAAGGIIVSDRVKITRGEHKDKLGIVQAIRGREVTVRIPSPRGNTMAPTVALEDVERVQ